MILVNFKIEHGSDVTCTEFFYLENLKLENYAGLDACFVFAPEGKYINENLLEEVYGEPEGGFEEAEQSVGVYDYGDDTIISVVAVHDLNVEQLETLRAFNIVR